MIAVIGHKNVLPSSEEVSIRVSGSKSESNRLLILQALFGTISLENVSNSNDTKQIENALSSQGNIIDIHHAGTAMRFLTAYFAASEGVDLVITGSQRMQERPIKILVEALQELGADICYEGEFGYPPIRIQGKKLILNEVYLMANVSSQYITALMLIAGYLEKGLTIHLQGEITSRSYIEMSQSLLERVGISTRFVGNRIDIEPIRNLTEKTLIVESDWSSASYYYSLVALSEKSSIHLSSYSLDSLQGDSELAEIYKEFGVQTKFHSEKKSMVLSKVSHAELGHIELNLVNTPDIAQTIAVTCFGLGRTCKLHGLHTLKIKETDRLIALKTELEKLGAQVEITKDSLELLPSNDIIPNRCIETYQDHRMAMAFAPLALKTTMTINNAEVVEKSYPDFWRDLQKAGVSVDLQ